MRKSAGSGRSVRLWPASSSALARFETFRYHRDSYALWLKPEPEKPLIDF
jgi:hypothetical protein